MIIHQINSKSKYLNKMMNLKLIYKNKFINKMINLYFLSNNQIKVNYFTNISKNKIQIFLMIRFNKLNKNKMNRTFQYKLMNVKNQINN